MKRLIKYFFLPACLCLVLGACTDDGEAGLPFGPDVESIEIGPEGGTETFRINADGVWTASVNNEWIKITPTNGNSSTDITIRVDSTLSSDIRADVIRFQQPGLTREVSVVQGGFGKQIVILDEEQKTVNVPDFEVLKNANFYIDVTSNVSYRVNTGVSWLHARTTAVTAEAKAKPRTHRIYFDYDANIEPEELLATITFSPSADDPTEVKRDEVEVIQQAAPIIEPGRLGDSLAIRTLLRLMNANTSDFPEDLAMDYWDGVELNENGRVKYLRLYMFEHHTLFPYHIKYLTEMEEFECWGGIGVTAITPASLGPEIATLTNTTKLWLDALSLVEIDPALYTMSWLETLSLTSNNLYQVPDEINPDNFPNLKHFYLINNSRHHVYDLSNSKYDLEEIGPHGEFPRRLLEWENLESLALNANYYEGSIPDMLDHDKFWERGICEEWDEILDERPDLLGTVRVLPNCKDFRINLNRFTGDIPQWIFDHPHLCKWVPYTFIFNQEGFDSLGQPAKFNNVPDKLDCYEETIED